MDLPNAHHPQAQQINFNRRPILHPESRLLYNIPLLLMFRHEGVSLSSSGSSVDQTSGLPRHVYDGQRSTIISNYSSNPVSSATQLTQLLLPEMSSLVDFIIVSIELHSTDESSSEMPRQGELFMYMLHLPYLCITTPVGQPLTSTRIIHSAFADLILPPLRDRSIVRNDFPTHLRDVLHYKYPLSDHHTD